jgi:uncharacterized glyoxalase superfamily protein PhnB
MKPQAEQSVRASVDVSVDPATAFRIFTQEIDAWWDRGPHNFYDGGRAAAIRFEPGVGGRFLEIYDEAAGDFLEIGRITLWDPGRRFVFRLSLSDTAVDIRFEPISGGTRVMLEQRTVPPAANIWFYTGWQNILGWFASGTAPNHRTSSRDLHRVIPILHYENTAAAAEWLIRVFGLRPRHENPIVTRDELLMGDSMVMLWPGAAKQSHSVYVYVDDLEAHFARAQAGGARIVQEIQRHGDRTYIAEDLEAHKWIFAQARPTQRHCR